MKAEIDIPKRFLTCGKLLGVMADGTIVLCTGEFKHEGRCDSPLLAMCVTFYPQARGAA